MFKPFFLFCIALIVSTSSCTKCITCTATWTDPVDTTNTQVINSYEYCGTKKDIKDFEETWKSSYTDAMYTKVSCE